MPLVYIKNKKNSDRFNFEHFIGPKTLMSEILKCPNLQFINSDKIRKQVHAGKKGVYEVDEDNRLSRMKPYMPVVSYACKII